MMNRLRLGIYGLCAVLLLQTTTSCKKANAQESESANKKQEIAPRPALKKQDLELLQIATTDRGLATTVSGRVIPKHTTQLFAEVQGKIEPTSRPFKAGTNFKSGETLIRIDDTEFAYNLESQRAAFLNVLTGILPDLKSDYPESYLLWLDYVQNYKAGNALTDLPKPGSTAEQFFLTNNQVYSLYFQIKSLEERLTKYSIQAPYSGIITATNIDVGSLVSPGQSLGTITSSISYELEAGVPLKAMANLRIGDKVTFSNNEVPGEWTGTVIRINNQIDPATQNIPVYFKLYGNKLRSGMYLEGKLTIQNLESVSLIPNEALGRDESVLVLEENVITRKSIEPVAFLTDSIIIRGLRNDDLVILNQFDIPAEGIKVAL
ncbi:MAG: efflux RND transporter periplasmic adaptor subunit [Phaeodactylibacter sp.]|nr:efflux RND transporter periplasmic adaptor subunit [Phaeodactylibacter sp.]